MPPAVNDHQLRPSQLGPDDRPADGRQLAGQVHAIHNNHFAPGQLADGIGRRRHAQHFEQDVDRVVAINPGTVVHVVRADHRPGQFLEQVGFLIGAAGRVQEGEGIRAVLCADLLHAASDEPERLLPRDFPELAVLLEQRAFQPIRRTGHLVHMPAPETDVSRVRGVRHAWIGPHDLVADRLQVYPAANPAEGASGKLMSHASPSVR